MPNRPSSPVLLLVPGDKESWGGGSPAAPWAGRVGQHCWPCPAPGDGSRAAAALPWHEPKLFQAAGFCHARTAQEPRPPSWG